MDNEIPVDISYHRQRSSTARIRSGTIYLRISSLVSRREQQQHIDDLIEKMMRNWDRKQGKIQLTLRSLFKEVDGQWSMVNGSLLLSTGVEYEVKLRKAAVKKIKVEKIGHVLTLLQPVDELVFDEDAAELVLWKFLAKDQIGLLEDRLDTLREGWIDEDFSQLRLRQVMSRWGSCDRSTGTIMLSVKLLLVEPKLLDYVCVHELAHLRYADHSDLFWDLVTQKMPDWKIQRKRLKQYE